ncbi:hypothetical protein ACFVUW_09565 [Streptomyces xiamenensis]|uniref:hypothetical protein n=1 Tax=Streptomyces xiamenensis TaxID=408015 RepID=UPI0036E6AD38
MRLRNVMLAASLPALLLAGCASAEKESEPASGAGAGSEEAESTPHGYVEGAEEAAEPQSRLVLADGDTGEIRVLDLITEEITEVGHTQQPTAIRGDGRYGYLTSADGSVQVVDSGAWTVDHGDHSHYYRATIALGETLPAGTLPYKDAEVTVADGTVRAPGVDEPCAAPKGTAVTRAGLVLGCADGALLITAAEETDAEEGQFTAERLPYPDGTAEDARAGEFRHRAGSTTLAATAVNGEGFWTLDVLTGQWEFTADDSVVAVNAVGNGGVVLALTDSGELLSLDPDSGEEIARTELPGDSIEVDSSRAYVSDVAGQKIHEIDYADDLRIARTFDLDIAPSHMVETGR